MSTIVLSSGGRETAYALKRAAITVGTEPFHDIVIESKTKGAHFTLSMYGNRVEVLEGVARLRVNGSRISSRQSLAPCDRIEWDGNAAIFIAENDYFSGRVIEVDGGQRI
jgi:pSer/pThr/pTyr-binding forkhead associated (FHA) protein